MNRNAFLHPWHRTGRLILLPRRRYARLSIFEYLEKAVIKRLKILPQHPVQLLPDESASTRRRVLQLF